MLRHLTRHRRVVVNQPHAFFVASFMILAACSSAPSANNDASVSDHQPSTMFHEQRIESGLFGNTIQFWLLHHGLTKDHKSELDDQRVNQPVDRPMDRQAEQRLGRSTIQKPERQVDRPLNQKPVRRLNRPVNRTMNRQLDRRN